MREREREREKRRKRVDALKELGTNIFTFRTNGLAYMCTGFGATPTFKIYSCDMRDRVLMDYEIAISSLLPVRYVHYAKYSRST